MYITIKRLTKLILLWNINNIMWYHFLLSFCSFSFGHCFVCPSIYGFCLLFWYLQTVFRLLTDFVCLYTYGFWLSLCKIARSSVILLLPLVGNYLFMNIFILSLIFKGLIDVIYMVPLGFSELSFAFFLEMSVFFKIPSTFWCIFILIVLLTFHYKRE
jgi:hypothetical protein